MTNPADTARPRSRGLRVLMFEGHLTSMKKILTTSAGSVATVIALANCSGGTSSSMPGMNHDSSGMSSSSAPAAAGDHSDDDTMFTQGMIPHHTQAVEMADMLLKKRNIPAPVTALATTIKAALAPEISCAGPGTGMTGFGQRAQRRTPPSTDPDYTK